MFGTTTCKSFLCLKDTKITHILRLCCDDNNNKSLQLLHKFIELSRVNSTTPKAVILYRITLAKQGKSLKLK